MNDLKPADLLERILRAVEPYEFSTFVIGFDRGDMYDRARHEDLYRGWKREIGEELTRRRPGVDADFLRPEIRIDVRPNGDLAIQSAPLFIGGRYRKLSREIPATRWIHHACHGLGCPTCSHTGNLCGPSIQELIEAPVLRSTGGKRTRLHGLGREDVDARMLGRGRPFVLEVHHPVRRSPDLEQVRDELHRLADGSAEVSELTLVGPEARTEVKEADAEKTYRAWLELSKPPDPAAVRRIEGLSGAVIDQLSPSRVMHRRGCDTMRKRKLIDSSWLGEIDGRCAWEVRLEAGAYVKELVSGDGGRTRPSLAEVLGFPCRCTALDVLEIHWEPSWEAQDASPAKGSPGGGYG